MQIRREVQPADTMSSWTVKPTEFGSDPDAEKYALLVVKMASQFQKIVDKGRPGIWCVILPSVRELGKEDTQAPAALFVDARTASQVPNSDRLINQVDFSTHLLMLVVVAPRFREFFTVPLEAVVTFQDRRIITLAPIEAEEEGLESIHFRRCATCQSRDRLKRCRKCQSIFYCDRECQLAHWPIHKAVCEQHVNA